MPDISLVLESLMHHDLVDSFDYGGMPALQSPTNSDASSTASLDDDTGSLPSLDSLTSDESEAEDDLRPRPKTVLAYDPLDAYTTFGGPAVIAPLHTNTNYWGLPSGCHTVLHTHAIGDLQCGERFVTMDYTFLRAHMPVWEERVKFTESLHQALLILVWYRMRIDDPDLPHSFRAHAHEIALHVTELEEQEQELARGDPVAFNNAVALARHADHLAILDRQYTHLVRECLLAGAVALLNSMGEHIRCHNLHMDAVICMPRGPSVMYKMEGVLYWCPSGTLSATGAYEVTMSGTTVKPLLLHKTNNQI
ncbi:hypothetical protein C8J57DRAFT_1536879 [Mycena rebaudengoi]|nr:hypothetical protein C8J57DRAFT_1536879 [Mycena rebaudengoi]